MSEEAYKELKEEQFKIRQEIAKKTIVTLILTSYDVGCLLGAIAVATKAVDASNPEEQEMLADFKAVAAKLIAT